MTTVSPPGGKPGTGGRYSEGDAQVHVDGDNAGTIVQVLAGPYGLPREVAHLLRPSVGPYSLTWSGRARLRDVFVAPATYTALLATLRHERVLVLSGDPGTGRRTAAVMLLTDVTGDGGACHEIPSDGDEEEASGLDFADVPDGAGLLLDLSSSSGAEIVTQLVALDRKRQQFEDRNCHLVVTVPRAVGTALPGLWARHLRRIDAPPVREVLRRQLTSWEIVATDRDLTEIMAGLSMRGMAEVARLATLIAAERDRDPRAGLGSWARLARTVLENKAAEVSDWIDQHPSGHDRALLLSAAMLEGASVDAVWAANMAVRNTVVVPEVEALPLERQGLTGHLRSVGFEVRDGRTVRFARSDFHHRHVRDYFWADHPELRDQLRRWVQEFTRHDVLTPQERLMFTVRFTEQCLAVNRPDQVTHVAAEWGKRDGNDLARRLRCARAMLRVGLVDERHGWHFRRRIREWASQRSSGLVADFHLMLVELCADVIAPRYPEQALVRLHHLARREEPLVADEAANALAALARDRFVLRRTISRLNTVLVGHGDLRDVALFCRLVHPGRLLDTQSSGRPLLVATEVRQQVLDGWRVALRCEPDGWRSGVRLWLTAMLDAPERDTLLDLLVDASDGDVVALSRLEYVAAEWSASLPEERRTDGARILAALISRIDTTQKLFFLTRNGEPR